MVKQMTTKSEQSNSNKKNYIRLAKKDTKYCPKYRLMCHYYQFSELKKQISNGNKILHSLGTFNLYLFLVSSTHQFFIFDMGFLLNKSFD